MTQSVRGWIGARRPAAPPALLARIDEALGVDDGDADVVEQCVRTAEVILARLLADGSTTRAAALDLLAADALATYAFEAAADDPDALPARAREAMVRLSACAADAVGAA